MKLSHLVLSVILLALALPSPAHAGWNMVYHDEFDGPTLNRDEWFTRGMANGDSLDHQNDEKQLYRDNDNHVFTDGHLSLTARWMGGDKYESGMIRSKRSFYYGYFESRVKLPSGIGMWPAFWFCADYDADGNTGWPPEYDAFEFANNGKDDTAFVIHAPGGDNPIYADPHYQHNGYHSDVDLTKDWHTIGLMWLPDTVTMYMDGVKVYTTKEQWTYKDGRLAGPAYIIFNLAVGGQWAGRYGIDNTKFPQSLDVDYVRVYQFDANKPSTVTSLPNVPDLANISYNGPGDLTRAVVYPAQIPATAKPGSLLKVIYHIDSIPTKNKTKLRVSINDAAGKIVYLQSAELPHDTRQAAEMIKAQVSVALPNEIPEGEYEVRLALGSCSTPDCKPENFTANLPLTPADGAVREASAFYRVGRFKVED